MEPILQLPRNSSRDRRGVALVIVLAFVVLVTAIVLAFFSRAMLSRQVSSSSAGLTKADMIARGALDIIVGDLKQEIVTGSDTNTVGGTTIYTPKTQTSMLPMRSGNPSFIPPAPDPIPSLVRRSVQPDAIALPGLSSRASAVSSTNASPNGRSVSAARWNSHYLIPKLNTGDDATDPVAVFSPPDWVIVTRGGPVAFTDWDNSLKDGSPANANYAVGRYAFAIYNEAGLLDMNVAGYTSNTPANSAHPAPTPSNLPTWGYANKGSIAFADLTQLGTFGLSQPQIDNIVGWRNFATALPAGNFGNFTFTATAALRYHDYALTNTNGFLKVSTNTVSGNQTDQALLSRQQLIKLCRSLGFSVNALQYMGTFSRALNAPSWMPTATTGNPAGNTIDYAGQADTPSCANRNIPNVRFPNAATITHYRDDGTSTTYPVNQGDPLVQRRFSLAKLAWLTPDGNPPAGVTANAIRACFGLNWNISKWRWDYVGPLGATSQHSIKTLDQVANESPTREPNFFEMLKAGILSGSLGRDPGPGINFVRPGIFANFINGSKATDPSYKADADMHILQIGANIIDQFDTDSYPTAIHLDRWGLTGVDDIVLQTVYGDENLPGLTGLFPIAIADPAPGYANDPQASLKSWLQPALWNPHQVPTATLDGYPSGFRTYAYGQTQGIYQLGSGGARKAPVPGPVTIYDDGTGDVTICPDIDRGIIYFTDPGTAASPFYNNPTPLTSSLIDTTATPDTNFFDQKWKTLASGTTNEFAGISLLAIGPENGSFHYTPAPSPPNILGFYIYPDLVEMLSISLQYMGSDNNYHPYNFMARLTPDMLSSGKYFMSADGVATTLGTAARQGWGGVRPDPRTDRFSEGTDWINSQNIAVNTMNQQPGTYRGFTGPGYGVAPDFMGAPNLPCFIYNNSWQASYWSANNPAIKNIYYADPDGVVRYGDAHRANIASGDGCPLYHGNATLTVNRPSTIASPGIGSAQARRPVILNRPFRSVGDLGYAYRDLPYKSLDLWSPTSGDAGLLDLFSVSDQPAVVAGQINPGSASAPVLQAVLSRAFKSDILNVQISATDTGTLSGTMAADLSANGPYRNRADLATRLGPLVSGTNAGVAFNTGIAANANWANKAYAEATMRAMADVSNTRTWNLMIDVIAQTGMFPPNATTLSNFIVQGERRYWLHIAIDRFTGKIVDQQLEPVYE